MYNHKIHSSVSLTWKIFGWMGLYFECPIWNSNLKWILTGEPTEEAWSDEERGVATEWCPRETAGGGGATPIALPWNIMSVLVFSAFFTKTELNFSAENAEMTENSVGTAYKLIKKSSWESAENLFRNVCCWADFAEMNYGHEWILLRIYWESAENLESQFFSALLLNSCSEPENSS